MGHPNVNWDPQERPNQNPVLFDFFLSFMVDFRHPFEDQTKKEKPPQPVTVSVTLLDIAAFGV
jgi:hypothetical protein